MERPADSVRHEPRDIDKRIILRFAAALVMVMIGVTLLLLVLFRHFGALAARNDPPPPPLARYEAGQPPPKPRLQTQPAQDLAAVRAGDHEALDGYGWIDEKTGVVHIPIERAIELTAERSLPARPDSLSGSGR